MQTATKFRMMPGSSSGNTYLLVGRRGKFALGIKPVAVMRGDAYGVPNHTWFGSKLRSAPAAESMFDGFEKTSAKLKHQPTDPADAWPMVTWDQVSAQRASAIVGIMLEGVPDAIPEVAQKLLDEVRNDLGMRMADYLYGLVGEDNMLLLKGEIAEWFDGHFTKIADGIEKMIANHNQMAQAMKESVGTFKTQAELLKKIHDAHAKTAPAAVDEGESGDDEDDDGIDD